MIRLVLQALALALLLAICGTLTWRVVELTQTPLDIAPERQVWSPAIPSSKSLARLEHRAVTAFPETLARPLFFEGRRFPTKPIVTPKAPPAPPPPPPKAIVSPNQFRLLGIVQYGADRRALIEGPSVLLDWYMEGAKLQDWTLSRIENTGVFLSFENRSAELRLFGGADQN